MACFSVVFGNPFVEVTLFSSLFVFIFSQPITLHINFTKHYSICCRNVSHKQQSFSGIQSPWWSFSIKVCYSWVQAIFLLTIILLSFIFSLHCFVITEEKSPVKTWTVPFNKINTCKFYLQRSKSFDFHWRWPSNEHLEKTYVLTLLWPSWKHHPIKSDFSI